MLTERQLGEYQEQGFVFPLPVFSHEEVPTIRGKLETLEAGHNGRLPAPVNRKPHLILTWLNTLIRDARIRPG